ncbi:maleylpyruvate isomerase family mycothiol-dependent enzyme [Actinoplanes bogorensis]|uniref:Maleylpyruvate isomerase family mycothiol-dependent enzyme n=1 Tax=Paractinoplanes bogorensis TaxID=1610840 RepID=A0ABS5Z1N1_9ACTN|nr:maleylpyruvate isomerase family mycothiol-dependent enzyme [Actinoplanes bogorensis]MBU2669611.1 maleylpyruvate isomerase family mycothiol-dependent enzyme [Actinoplanes bogorensis]
MTLDHLALLHDELAAFQDCLTGDLSAPVEHCGDWTLHDLVVHLGQENLWAAAAVRELRGDYVAEPPPADVVPWFADTARTLTDTLAVDPATEAWTFFPPHTVGFWRRRRCLETLVHRWDAEQAAGRPSTLNPALCGDGIAEVIDGFVPRQIRLGRMDPLQAAIRLNATDLPASWQLGPGVPVAELSGTAADLLLMLWGRLPAPWQTLTGNETAARDILRGPLVP